jgi:hypothetical protein
MHDRIGRCQQRMGILTVLVVEDCGAGSGRRTRFGFNIHSLSTGGRVLSYLIEFIFSLDNYSRSID